MKKPIISWLIVAELLVACCAQKPPRSMEMASSRVILTGWLTSDQIFGQIKAYQLGKEKYQPDEESIAKLKSITSDIQILVFLGTWCSDSEREVPRFLKIMEQTKNSHITFKLLGLDRSKRDADGLAEKYQIEYVPTFIVIRQNEEIGRIVEAPMISLEQDLVEIATSVTE